MNVRRLDRLVVLLLGLTVIGLTGCGGVGDVSGKITYNGKAVPIGYVVFFASDQRVYNGVITEGAYRLTVPAGDSLVAVISDAPTVMKRPTPSPKDPKVPRMVQKAWPPELEKKWFKIPDHYRQHNESGLQFTVRRGENTIDIELTDGPPMAK